MSRRAGRAGWDIGPEEDTDFGIEAFRVERHMVVDILVEVDRIVSEVDRIEFGVDHIESVGRRWVIDFDIHLGWVVECRSGMEFRLVEVGSLAVGRREDSPAVLDCSNFRQTFYFTRNLEERMLFCLRNWTGSGVAFISEPVAQYRLISYFKCMWTRTAFWGAVSELHKF